jgi:hypothetical protein
MLGAPLPAGAGTTGIYDPTNPSRGQFTNPALAHTGLGLSRQAALAKAGGNMSGMYQPPVTTLPAPYNPPGGGPGYVNNGIGPAPYPGGGGGLGGGLGYGSIGGGQNDIISRLLGHPTLGPMLQQWIGGMDKSPGGMVDPQMSQNNMGGDVGFPGYTDASGKFVNYPTDNSGYTPQSPQQQQQMLQQSMNNMFSGGATPTLGNLASGTMPPRSRY